MAKIKKMEQFNETIYPVTHEDAVFDNEGISIGEKLNDINNNKADKSDLFSGDYNDLTNKPEIPNVEGLASESYVNNAIADIVDSSPETLNTLNELAQALGDDANFATTVSNQIGQKADRSELFSGSYNDLTNKPVIPSIDGLASESYVQQEIAKIQHPTYDDTSIKNQLANKADKSELFSGDYEDLINKPVIPNVDEFATKDEIPTFIDLGFYEDVDNSNNNNNINNTGNSNIDIEDVNFIHVTKGINLCNDDKAIVGAYSSDGSFSASTKYQYVEIKVKPGQLVKGIPGADINYKLFVLVDDNGNVLGVSDKEGEYVVTRTYTTINGTGQHYYSLTVPEGVSMIYFQYQVSYAGLYNMLVIDNDMPSTYIPYEEKISLDEKIYVQNSKYADYANSITSPLKDKNIGFLGDSFTASDNAYHSFIAERTGCIRYNYGIGGTRITLDSTSGESFIHRVASMRDDLDIICVFGGINDASKYSLYETDHGTINDEILTDEEIQNGTEPLTFYSGVKTLISMLIAKYPEKPIVMIIPPHVLDATYEPALTAYNGIEKIVNALRECAEYYAIPTIDLYKNAQYLNNHPTNVSLYRTAMNNIHPNTKAHIRMSYDIQKGLENIIW